MIEVKQNAADVFKIFMVDASTKQPKTDLVQGDFTVYLAKAGVAEATVAVTITPRGNGFYEVTPLAAHRDTLGESAWTFTATAADPFPRIEKVVTGAAVDVWTHNDRTLTAHGNLLAAINAIVGAAGSGGLTTAQAQQLTDILTDTDDLQQRSMATPTDVTSARDVITATQTTHTTKLDAITDYVDELETRLPSDTPTRLNNLDATISSRLATLSYVDHSADVAAIKTKTDQLTFTGGRVDSHAGGITDAVLSAFVTRDLGVLTVSGNSVATYAQGAGGGGGDVNVVTIGGVTITAQMAAAFTYFFDQASPAKRVNDVGTASGGSGGTDWTSSEKEQIRYRLGVDGTATAPVTNTPNLGLITANVTHVTGTAVVDVTDFHASGFSTFDPLADSVTVGGWSASTVGLTTTQKSDVRAEVSAELALRQVTAAAMTNLDAAITSRPTAAAIDTQLSGTHGAGAWGGSADWTATEREQIRYRIGIDGTASEPTAEANLTVTIRPNVVIDANTPNVDEALSFTLTQRDDFENDGEIGPIGPIRIETDLDLLPATDAPRLRFGATQSIGRRYSDSVHMIGTAYAVAVAGEPNQYDIFLEIDGNELDRPPGEYGWDVEAVWTDGDQRTLVTGSLTLRVSMGDNETRDPLLV